MQRLSPPSFELGRPTKRSCLPHTTHGHPKVSILQLRRGATRYHLTRRPWSVANLGGDMETMVIYHAAVLLLLPRKALSPTSRPPTSLSSTPLVKIVHNSLIEPQRLTLSNCKSSCPLHLPRLPTLRTTTPNPHAMIILPSRSRSEDANPPFQRPLSLSP
jgi:hypothetical protein